MGFWGPISSFVDSVQWGSWGPLLTPTRVSPQFYLKKYKKSAFHCHLRDLIHDYSLNPYLGVLLNPMGVVSLLRNATLPKYQWGSKSTKNFQTWFIEANFDLCSSRAQEDAKQYFFGKVNLDIKMVNPWPHKDCQYRSKYSVVLSWELSRKKQSKMRHPVLASIKTFDNESSI